MYAALVVVVMCRDDQNLICRRFGGLSVEKKEREKSRPVQKQKRDPDEAVKEMK